MISFSIHGASVNDLIGATAFNNVVKGAAAAFLQSSNQKVGVLNFGGINGDSSSLSDQLRALSTGTAADVTTAIDGMSVVYADHTANVAQRAMTDANAALSGESGRQKYHVIFSATIPLANGKGTSTTPTDIDNICIPARAAKAAGIQTYVVLVGTAGENAFPSFWSCAVEDPATDIIVHDPTSTDYTAITALLCKTNGIDLQITEVNPVAGTYAAFVEILNRGASASVRACLGSAANGDCSTGTNVDNGEYLVASVGGGVNGDVTASLPSSSPTTDTWSAYARVGTTTYDTVLYTGTYAQNALSGRSFELRAIGYNNDYPANWRPACYNVDGTPGSAPLAACALVTDSCPQTVTSDLGCTHNGAAAQSPQCNSGSSQAYCECPDTSYIEDTDSCALPVPVTATTCEANVAKWWDGNDYIFYQFDKVLYDGNVLYAITDNEGTNAATESTLSGLGNTAFTSNLGNAFSLSVVATSYSTQAGTGTGAPSTTISCGNAVTENPTSSPSLSPTGRPSEEPSESPTLRPTYDSPGVYMESVKDRGVCGGGEARSCCSPFGPQYGDTNTGGTEPSTGECSPYDNNEEIELLDSDGDFLQKEFVFKLYPEGFEDETTVTVAIYAYGLINQTDWANLTFTGTYPDDGLIPTIIGTDNQFEWGTDATTTRRRRLQNGTNTNSYTYGNKLNIGITPPGDSASWTDVITIPQGSSSGSFTMNISLADLKCNEGDFDCTTYADCQEWSLAFAIVTLDCQNQTHILGECKPLFPSTRFIAIRRSDALCAINFGIGNQEDELPDWFWWVLIALIVFLLILAWLVYRFWWKQKKTATELGDAEDELDQQIADNEAGFGKELDVGDVAFNPMATGVPGMNRPADAFGNELHQRQIEQQNDMVDVQAEIFQVRQDYGQVNTGNRHHNQGGMGQGGY
eukprot:CAMPEP_0201564396 /NCGR_PEP_ID=MMETSP0190_2-20130828/2683_1 /ASSEMBLY_ACC=CAM_ASM_000263 /TAXON_ID=37353 /ORGANISM="Rosalina sp." /LENGTH=919 /DNA_ID=CAMNT_0047980545 /DNA_START=244 /DNA_END=3003 /DNA_ORIENTATION=-